MVQQYRITARNAHLFDRSQGRGPAVRLHEPDFSAAGLLLLLAFPPLQAAAILHSTCSGSWPTRRSTSHSGADGRFGETSAALISPANPVGLDRSSPNGADDLVTLNDLHLPINRPVVIQLSSKDVIHSFGVAAMRVKQDATPGFLSPVWFTPTLAGRFDVACSQLCGLGHFRMKAVITVESEAGFLAFLAAEAALLTPDPTVRPPS